jgi:ribosomal protein L1
MLMLTLGTVTDNVVEAMRQQADAVLFKVDPNSFLSAVVGETGMASRDLEDNIKSLTKAIQAIKKGKRAFCFLLSM